MNHRADLPFYVAMAAACILTGRAQPTVDELAAVADRVGTTLSAAMIEDALSVVRIDYEQLGANDKVSKGNELIGRIKQTLQARFAQ